MKSIPTPWTHVAVTAREIPGAELGARWAEYTVPAGTRCHCIGRWVISDLGWLAKQHEALFAQRHPDTAASFDPGYGRRSIDYFDADHYGIQVDQKDLTDIREEAGGGGRGRRA